VRQDVLADREVDVGVEAEDLLRLADLVLESAAPCALPVFCRVGAGQPMIVLTAMKDGLSVTALAFSIASSSAVTSSPESTRWTCHPYASYRATTSSLNATAVLSSIEMWLSS